MWKAPVGFTGACQGTRWRHLAQLGQTLPDPNPGCCLAYSPQSGGWGGLPAPPPPHLCAQLPPGPETSQPK